jgi:hypothetical protein
MGPGASSGRIRDVALSSCGAQPGTYRGRGRAANLDPLGFGNEPGRQTRPGFFRDRRHRVDPEIKPPSLNVLADTPRGLLAHLREVYTGSISSMRPCRRRCCALALYRRGMRRRDAGPMGASRLPTNHRGFEFEFFGALPPAKSVLALMAQKR